MRFGPQNKDDAAIFAFEELRADIQYGILRRMKEAGITQAMLAKKLNTSPAWVSQILSDDANLTLESVSKIFLALGSQCHFESGPLGNHFATSWDEEWAGADWSSRLEEQREAVDAASSSIDDICRADGIGRYGDVRPGLALAA